MATVLSLSADDNTQIQWESTNGNDITFRVTADVTLASGDKCVQTGHSINYNTNFPTDIPELHIDIVEDTSNGTEVLNVSELITVTMNDIYEAAMIKLVIKENGNTEGESVYQENPDHIERPHNQ